MIFQCFHFYKRVSFEGDNCSNLPGLPIFRIGHLSLHPRSRLFWSQQGVEMVNGHTLLFEGSEAGSAGASQSIPRHALLAASLALMHQLC